jgi:hypothetical protein
MRMKRIGIAATIGIAAIVLTACGRNIDIETTGAKPVPGANALYYFCHGPTLIYFSKWESQSDEYEAMWPGWCVKGKDKKWFYDVDNAPLPAATSNGNTDDGDK